MLTMADMVKARSLKEILVMLSQVACGLSGAFQVALSLWLQMQDVMLQQKRKALLLSPSSVAAVQAALHAVPKSGADEQKLAWMKLHVPIVKKAMIAHVVAQSDTSLKRLKVLKQLVLGQRESAREHLAEQLSTDVALHGQLNAAGKIATAIAPLATIVESLSLSRSWTASQTAVARKGRYEHILAHMQRDELLVHMMRDLSTERGRIANHLVAIGEAMQDICRTLDETTKNSPVCDGGIGSITRNTECLLESVSVFWLWLAVQVPPSSDHLASQAWLVVTDWEALIAAPKQPRPQQLQVMRCTILGVLTRPDLYRYMTTGEMQSNTGGLLLAYDIQHQQLRDAGVSEERVQQLMLLRQQAHEKTKDAATSSGSQERGAGDGSQGDSAGDGGARTTAAAAAAAAASDNNDDRLGDMQSLLELMYGTLNFNSDR